MSQSGCPKCLEKHNLYYLIKSNNTRAMFVLCPKMKGREQVFVLFLPLQEGLDIPSYLSGSNAYEELKNSVAVDGEFSEQDRRIISLWRTARLTMQSMDRSQMELIKRYVKGSPRW